MNNAFIISCDYRVWTIAADETFSYQLPQKYNNDETMLWWCFAQQMCTGVFYFLNSQDYLVPREEQAHDTDCISDDPTIE